MTLVTVARRGKGLLFQRVPLDQFEPEGLVDAFVESVGVPDLDLEATYERQLLEAYGKRRMKPPVSLGVQINSQ